MRANLNQRLKRLEDRVRPVPVTYTIDQGNRIIHTKCSGPVTIEEVIDHFGELEQDPDCPDLVDVLLDLSEETSIPTKQNLQDVASEISRVRGRVQFRNCAIVACTDALFGMLRMFEVFTEKYFQQTFVFRTPLDAEDWLSSRPIQPQALRAGKPDA